MQSRHMSADPDSNIRRHIEVSRIRIWLVLIDRRGPINRNAAENNTEEYGHIQPVAPANQQVVPLDHEHLRLARQRARGDRFIRVSC